MSPNTIHLLYVGWEVRSVGGGAGGAGGEEASDGSDAERPRSRYLRVPTSHGPESWVWQKQNNNRIDAVEVRSLRSMCGVFLKDRCGNSDIMGLYGLKEDVASRVEKGVLWWIDHLERINESRLAKQIYRASIYGGTIGKGHPRKCYAE
ncbi:hypothetical protein EVAR_46895_1 [Eumeta japonica]|uniref:Uncharacterized protein n=1 Tax=Eumeta variegata TaxID=151549 RepID=A0A4C1YHD7_EUMVA|nr:hypothetical protein EVAR_46895_1 [Eumeta japonica]